MDEVEEKICHQLLDSRRVPGGTTLEGSPTYTVARRIQALIWQLEKAGEMLKDLDRVWRGRRKMKIYRVFIKEIGRVLNGLE